MRKVMESQMTLGEVDVSQILIDPTSRDEIPQLLLGLQHACRSPERRAKIFDILEKMDAGRASPANGRPGMDLWRVLVLGLLRLLCGWDYAKLSFMASTNVMIQQFLGHSCLDFPRLARYCEQTVRDNLSILTPEALEKISQVIIDAGHMLHKADNKPLAGKCDSYVLETNVHFPTDLSLVFDAVRKTIELTAALAAALGLPGWRQSGHNKEKVRKIFNKVRRASHRRKGDEAGVSEAVVDAVSEYMAVSREMVGRAQDTLAKAAAAAGESKIFAEASDYAAMAVYLIDQMERRILFGESIPHDEKIFSVFKGYTEWICKGKAGKPQELGVRVCILQDQHQFILHHKVMWNLTDEKVPAEMVEQAKKKFNLLNSCSFDKGFHSPAAQEAVRKIIDLVIIPKKGRRNKEETAREESAEFVAGRKAHPAIESAINALEDHGLDCCPDRGKEALERYVAIGVLARNVQILGKMIAGRMILKMRRAKAKEERKTRMAA
jgi:hypothetical protein